MRFIAIDFETANSSRNSVCEIGIAVVENSKIIESISYLVRPIDNKFDYYNTRIHGIDADKVKDEPEFNEIWNKIKHYFAGSNVVAHNAGFDFSVLRQVLDLYEIEYPELKYSCSYQISKRAWKGQLSYRLDSMCKFLGIDLEHHNAKSDASACAEISIKAFSENNIQNFDEIEQTFNLKIGKLSKSGYSPALTNRKKKSSEIEFDSTKADENNIFYRQNVVFTGKLDSLTRKEAQKTILEIGGLCPSGINKETNFLVLGEQDFVTYGEGFKSSKIKKAEKLLADGQEIELLTESQFLEMI